MLKQQMLDDLGAPAAWRSVDIADGSPFECGDVISTLDTPLTYPTGTVDVTNYAAVAMIIAGTGSGISCATEASINGNQWVPSWGWPIAGGGAASPDYAAPTAVPATGEKGILYLYPVEYANFWRVQLRLQTSGTSFFVVGLLSQMPVIPGLNLTNSARARGFWSYASPSGGIINNTAVTIKAAAGSGIRNYVSQLTIKNVHATVATEYAIRDGAAGTVLHRGYAPALMLSGDNVPFNPALRTTAATLTELIMFTTGAQVYASAQGYTGS